MDGPNTAEARSVPGVLVWTRFMKLLPYLLSARKTSSKRYTAVLEVILNRPWLGTQRQLLLTSTR